MSERESLFSFLRRVARLGYYNPYQGPPVHSLFDGTTAPRVVIEWVDSASINGGLWVSRDQISPDALTTAGLKQRSVGFLIEQSDDAYLIAQTIGSDQLGAVLSIPKASVVAIAGWA